LFFLSSKKEKNIYKLKKNEICTYSPRVILSTKHSLKFFFIENPKMINGENLKVEDKLDKK